MQQSRQIKRTKGESRDSSKIKMKFQEQRTDLIKAKPIVPMNKKQEEYLQFLQEKSVVVATGYAGTSKTFLPVCYAADQFRLGKINKIIITRPAISSSKSVGFFTGSHTEKMQVWLIAAVSLLKERLGKGALDVALAAGDIEFLPLEVVKGLSLNDAFLIAEESSDLTQDEVVKLITRMGKNSTLVLAGDVRQAELKENSGLVWLTGFIERNNLDKHFGWVDFNDVNDIVRGPMVKEFITCLVKEEKQASKPNKRS